MNYLDIRILIALLLVIWQLWSGRTGARNGAQAEVGSEDSPFLYWLVLGGELAVLAYLLVQQSLASRGLSIWH